METQTGEPIRRFVGGPRILQCELIVTGDRTVTLELDRVVRIDPADSSFWSQWDGAIDIGYDFTKAGESTQWTASSRFTRRAERLETSIAGSSFYSSKQGAEDTSRHSLGVDVVRFVGQRWGLLALGQVERNDELQLRLRSQTGGGYQYRLCADEFHPLWSRSWSRPQP